MKSWEIIIKQMCTCFKTQIQVKVLSI